MSHTRLSQDCTFAVCSLRYTIGSNLPGCYVQVTRLSLDWLLCTLQDWVRLAWLLCARYTIESDLVVTVWLLHDWVRLGGLLHVSTLHGRLLTWWWSCCVFPGPPPTSASSSAPRSSSTGRTPCWSSARAAGCCRTPARPGGASTRPGPRPVCNKARAYTECN